MQSPPRKIIVSVADQRLDLHEGGKAIQSFPVSTSAFGLGSEPGSMKTPLGRCCISEKIGDGAPMGMVFKSRQPTGQIGSEEQPEDLVQTRILWLQGLEEENANTFGRYIYIHGTNHESSIGKQTSHGCIRMTNEDVIKLFELVEPGVEVIIQP